VVAAFDNAARAWRIVRAIVALVARCTIGAMAHCTIGIVARSSWRTAPCAKLLCCAAATVANREELLPTQWVSFP